MSEDKQKRIVVAPQPSLVSSSSLPPNRVISVELENAEDVEWVWMSLPDGTKYVSGYTIVKK
ncbi:hypothetical protein [Anabaena sp. CCY 9614]|uniref:hypothetical protein n=1 Tax=Anabaena sp. CCY 9614 TaxID=3103869 RepID=UPI0039C75D7A